MTYRVSVRGIPFETALALASLDGLAGAEEREDSLLLWFPDLASASAAARALSPHHAALDAVGYENWNHPWQSRWTAIDVGTRWRIAPEWDSTPPPPGRIRLTYRAGVSFGNGDHPATHLCLEAMEAIRPGDVFLDVGCGSGLLLEAARLCGARKALGCDVDAAAVAEAKQRGLDVVTGSVGAFRTASVDVAAMNIHLGALRELAVEFLRVLRPGGWGVVSGFLEDQMGEVRGLGFAVERAMVRDGWCAAVVRR